MGFIFDLSVIFLSFHPFVFIRVAGLTVYLVSDYLSDHLITNYLLPNYFLISSESSYFIPSFNAKIKIAFFAAAAKVKLVLLVSAVSSDISSFLSAYLGSNWFRHRTARGQRSTLLDRCCSFKKICELEQIRSVAPANFRDWTNRKLFCILTKQNKNSFRMKHLISVLL